MLLIFLSADPNLLDTLEAYDGSVDFLRSLELDGDALTKAIIGTMGDLDAYQLPDAKGYTAFSRCGWLAGWHTIGCTCCVF
jgi:Zn-dependent M16 (insulinase) family peptidase